MLRSIAFALLTVWIATLTALHVSAAEIIEPPSPTEATLGWTASRTALQSRLHQALTALATRDPWRADSGSIFETNLLHHILDDGSSRIECESDQPGDSEVYLYRCEFDLVSRYFNWTSKKNSIPAILFDAIEALVKKGSAPGLLHQEADDSRIVGLVDESTSSQVICERNQEQPSTFDALYRCQIDVRP